MNQNSPRYIFVLVLLLVFTLFSMGKDRLPEDVFDADLSRPIPFLKELVVDGNMEHNFCQRG